jgi:chromosome segregation ATPase
LIEEDKRFSSKVFTPIKPLNNSNQQSFRLNYLSEFISKQVEQNEEIYDALDKVEATVNSNHHAQVQKIDQLIIENQQQKEQSNFFLEKIDNNERNTDEILQSLQSLQHHNDQLNENMANEQLINQAILDQLSFQDQQLRHTNSQLDNYVTLANQLSEQLITQEKLLKEMEQKLEVQDIYHSTVMTKLDKQDAINEKILRQLDHLKSIFHERINSIVEKMEYSFQSTTDYFNDIFNKSGFMKPFLLSSRPKDTKEKEIEETNKVN